MAVMMSYKYRYRQALLALKMNGHDARSFEVFFNNFISRQQSLLQRLVVATEQQNLDRIAQYNELIEQVLSNYNQYYQVKANAATDDVFLFLYPPWFSSFERLLLWLGEFKPSLIFRIICGAVTDLRAEQTERVEQIKAETRRKERELTEAMARIQESVASPPILNFARRFGRPVVDGELSEMEEAMEAIKTAMVGVMESADVLRGRTVMKVRSVLSPIQTVRFLAAAIEFQLRVRSYGLQRDGLRNNNKS